MSDPSSLTSLIAQGLDQGYVFCEQDDFNDGSSFAFHEASNDQPMSYTRKTKTFCLAGTEMFYGSEPVAIVDQGTSATYSQFISYGTSVTLTVFAVGAEQEAIEYLATKATNVHSSVTFSTAIQALTVLTQQDKLAFSTKLLEIAYPLTGL